MLKKKRSKAEKASQVGNRGGGKVLRDGQVRQQHKDGARIR